VSWALSRSSRFHLSTEEMLEQGENWRFPQGEVGVERAVAGVSAGGAGEEESQAGSTTLKQARACRRGRRRRRTGGGSGSSRRSSVGGGVEQMKACGATKQKKSQGEGAGMSAGRRGGTEDGAAELTTFTHSPSTCRHERRLTTRSIELL
jgi:hypothetical protein